MTNLQSIIDAGGPWQQARIIGGQLLIQGDCREVMTVLPKVCAVLTDPPYGIGEDGGRFRDRKGGGHRVLAKKGWDKSAPEQPVFDALQTASESQIIWGGNYFSHMLPASKGWLYWDKLMGGDFADGELAWTNIDRALRKFTHCNKGGGKQHPTQKPIALMEWCLGFLPDTRTILDPFMGSGTTLVACQRLGRQGIGIELDADYFEIACRRVQDVVDRPPLFTPAPPKPTQDKMDL